MNNQIIPRRTPLGRMEITHGGQPSMRSRLDHSQTFGLQLPRATVSIKDKVVKWPGDTSSQVSAEAEMGSPITQYRAPGEMDSAHSAGWDSAVLVHELRQPLAAIVSNAEAGARWLNRDTPNVVAAIESAKKVIRDARAAADLMERLRNMFRGHGPQKTKLDINELIVEVLCRLEDRIAERRIVSKTTTVAESVYVLGDRLQLEQVLHNLVSNAIDAMEETADVDRMLLIHSCHEIDGTILVTVEDKGCGIDNVDRIFDPFYSTKEDGLGLGLWICRSIIQSHTGSLWAEKARHGGTKFSFTVPTPAHYA